MRLRGGRERREEMNSIDKNYSLCCYALSIRCTRRTLFLFLLLFLPRLQCQISPLALFLLNKEHTEKIPSAFEKCTSLGSALFSFAFLWLAGLFQNPRQFPFSVFPNINTELLNTYSCVLPSPNIKRGS